MKAILLLSSLLLHHHYCYYIIIIFTSLLLLHRKKNIKRVLQQAKQKQKIYNGTEKLTALKYN